jgi:aminopeptidase N
MKYKGNLLILTSFFISVFASAQLNQQKKEFTKADTLRGSITKGRQGWDVKHYALSVEVDIKNKSLKGSNQITYFESSGVKRMQIDLQQPMIIDSVVSEDGKRYAIENEGDIWYVRIRPDNIMLRLKPGIRKLTVYYHGTPKAALRAPWDGGLVWKKDTNGNPFVGTACQGLGASVWWPCKDHQSDEPDSGMTVKITAPDTLSAISNGRLKNISASNNGNKTWSWEVVNPINTYAVTMNIGKYSNWTDTLAGEGGKLDLSYWALTENIDKAKQQFTQVKPMLRCFENWFGKFPWYEDGYKLVETPFLGMEHQSAVAYGNGYKNGYLGNDLSGTGWGLKWDFIIVHESGHEWFGNNITTKDIADMWVHEGFTNYSETLYTEWLDGKKAGYEYNYGLRKNIQNDKNVIGIYGVNEEGSGDMYYKGANLLHTIRNSINDDAKFRNILRGMNKTFYHSTVTSKQVEEYISKESGMNFSKVFDQYLRTVQIPVLEYYLSNNGKELSYRWTNVVKGFDLRLVLETSDKKHNLDAKEQWKKVKLNKTSEPLDLSSIDRNYYVVLKKVK